MPQKTHRGTQIEKHWNVLYTELLPYGTNSKCRCHNLKVKLVTLMTTWQQNQLSKCRVYQIYHTVLDVNVFLSFTPRIHTSSAAVFVSLFILFLLRELMYLYLKSEIQIIFISVFMVVGVYRVHISVWRLIIPTECFRCFLQLLQSKSKLAFK
jgi:hypothetical protein